MFRSVKVRILCIFFLLSLVHLSQADSSINVLKRIGKQLTEFKLKHENLQRRIGEFLSIVYREFKEDGCFNTTIETFINKNDLDPYGNLNILRMELDLGSLLNDIVKISESTEINVRQESACEKVNDDIHKDLTSYGDELTNRLSNELKTQFEAQKKIVKEANEASQKNINSIHQTWLESFAQSQTTPEQIRNVLNNNIETLISSQNDSINELGKRLTDELKTKLDSQNQKTETNVNATLQQVLDTLRNTLSSSEKMRDVLKKHIPTLEVSLSEQTKLIRAGLPNSCSDAVASGNGPGVYQILIFNKPTSVYCDQFGKMMIQHQVEGQVDFFNRTWQEFKHGFGVPEGQFWMGLENIHLLTSSRRYELHLVVLDFNNVTNHVIYDNFQIGNESEMYKIKIGRFSGKRTFNRLQYHINMPFSTYDKNNGASNIKSNCTLEYKSGWWYYDNDTYYCFHSNFNQKVKINKNEDEMYVVRWSIGYPLKEASMYIKLH